MIQLKNYPSQSAITDLLQIMASLRNPDGGCPWDLEQSHQTLKQYLVEECYELIDAIDEEDDEAMADELGDVLLQIVFHCQLASEEGRFDLERVSRHLCEKLVRRHPHVFGSGDIDNAEKVVKQWDKIKQQEKRTQARTSLLDGIPKGLPAVQRAHKVQKKAAKVGFDWDDVNGPLDKIAEELDELRRAIKDENNNEAKQELGDLLFSCINVARFIDCHADDALMYTTKKFENRFRHVEDRVKKSGKQFEEFTLEELDQFWNEAKEKNNE